MGDGERRRLRWGWGLALGSAGHGKAGDSITERASELGRAEEQRVGEQGQ